jgi:ubiquinone/menaquinone biosynthesis C-methylase UbiE
MRSADFRLQCLPWLALTNETTGGSGSQPDELTTAKAKANRVDDGPVFEMEGIRVAPKKIANGIPCFDDSGYFYGEIDRDHTLALSTLARSIGWKTAALGVRSAYVRNYITNQNRSLFLSILHINESDRILDVGAGWGNISAQIAKGFPSTKVYAADKTVERLLFAEQIKNQEGLKNMHVLQCDITDPPFEKNFFDVVIMIGVLEWLGASVLNMPPKAAQERGLRAIHDIMKPGGRLLIGIENRISYELLLGHPDHSQIAFTSLMPRRLADRYMKLRGRGSYRTYTYSRRGYHRLLKDAGFQTIKSYAVLPDYRFPEKICDINKLKNATHRRITKAFPRQVVGALAPSFYIVAER